MNEETEGYVDGIDKKCMHDFGWEKPYKYLCLENQDEIRW
jgi:hypothetical protein